MKKVYDLTEGSILKKLFLVAVPVLITSLTQMAYNLTDMFWIGRVDQIGLNESAAFAAVGTAGYLPWLAFGFIFIAKIGTSVKISHAVGRKKEHEIDIFATNGLMLQIVFGIIFSLSILFFKNSFLAFFKISQQDTIVVKYALMYIPIIGGFMFIQFLINGFTSINEGIGKTKNNLGILGIGFVLNIILDPIFILVFKWGIRGAAIATVFAQFITLLIFYLVYKKNNPNIHLFRIKDINIKAMKEIIKIGVPVGIQSLLFTIISIYIARMVFVYGKDVVSAQRIGTQIEQLSWMVGGGFQTAMTVFVGQNFGALKFTRIRKGLLYLSLILMPYSILVASLLFFKSEWLMRLFTDSSPVIDAGMKYLKIISLTQFFIIIEEMFAGLFNGLGKSIIPSINSVLGNLLRIPIAYLLIVNMNELGIWWSLNISSIAKGAVLIFIAIFVLINLETLKNKKIEAI